jgi:hypothetical protein
MTMMVSIRGTEGRPSVTLQPKWWLVLTAFLPLNYLGGNLPHRAKLREQVLIPAH